MDRARRHVTAHRFRPHRTTRSHRTTRARRRTRPMHRPRRHPLAGAAGLFVSRKSSPLRADKGSWAAIRASSCQRSFRSTPLRPRERDLEPSFGASDAPTTCEWLQPGQNPDKNRSPGTFVCSLCGKLLDRACDNPVQSKQSKTIRYFDFVRILSGFCPDVSGCVRLPEVMI